MNGTSTNNISNTGNETKSISSRSRGGGSAVLARAREYNRIIEDNHNRRSKSYDRNNTNSSSNNNMIEMNHRSNGSYSNQNNSAIGSEQYSYYASSDKDDREDGISGTNRSQSGLSRGRNGDVVTSANANNPTPSQKSLSRSKQHQQKQSAKTNFHNSNKENNYREKDASQSQKKYNHQNHNHHQQQHYDEQSPQSQPQQPQNQQVVTPELLVDALSGHEDGLLAIAERLMEHYDSGYDAMGEAIIDAFADVQKLFQHVVEAAHMEGAAYEAGRKEEEIERLKRALGGDNTLNGGMGGIGGGNVSMDHVSANHDDSNNPNNSTSPMRHEEFVDQDVRDVLLEAIRKGQTLKDTNKFAECYHLYEQACNSASALLPVDSDHRGRLQLSIARAESMNAERACAILKYVMDDVLRSGLTSHSKIVMPDPSQRGDCVLTRHPPKSKIIDDSASVPGSGADGGVVLQSSEEALASMVEEMKEILEAPVYDNSPLQSVAQRFWAALGDAQRASTKTEERLEQKLGELKGDFLLAKMEWEEKYNELTLECERHKKQVDRLKITRYMEQARNGVSSLVTKEYDSGCDTTEYASTLDSPRSGRPSSVATISSLSHHAKSLVSTFSCTGERGEVSDRVKVNAGRMIHPRNRSPPPIRGSPRYSSRR